MNNVISEFIEGCRIAKVFPRDTEYRVFCYDSYFETEKEFYCSTLQQAEDAAEDWVLMK